MTSAKLPDASAFETTINNKPVSLFHLKNKNGVEVAITNFGGCIVGLLVPGKKGNLVDVIEGFNNVEGYQNSTDYYGALIGRFANRIANGKFTLEGVEYSLVINDAPNTLHGGKPGFESLVWDAEQIDSSTLKLSYLAKDMEAGFPGNLHVKVTYHLGDDDNSLSISYEATTDKTTVLNLTSHPYFNLNGAGNGTILDHTVQIFADKYIPVNSNLIPTGEIADIKDTPFDFTEPTAIGSRINTKNQQLKDGRGYDHCYALNAHDYHTPVAIAIGDKSGIKIEVFTQQPGMQFYSGNFMQGKYIMKHGKKDDFRTAFAMETQHYPDSPNQPNFPSTVLRPGDVYKSISSYKFSVIN